MTDRNQNDELRNLLRRGDPAGAGQLDAADIERMRRRVLAEAREGESLRSVLANAAAQGAYRRVAIGAAAAVLLVATGAAIAWRVKPESAGAVAHQPPAVSPGIGADSAVMPADLRPARTIHFVTESGTRVIWTFDPNFALYTEDAPSRS